MHLRIIRMSDTGRHRVQRRFGRIFKRWHTLNEDGESIHGSWTNTAAIEFIYFDNAADWAKGILAFHARPKSYSIMEEFYHP